jgi:hypothetical protein
MSSGAAHRPIKDIRITQWGASHLEQRRSTFVDLGPATLINPSEAGPCCARASFGGVPDALGAARRPARSSVPEDAKANQGKRPAACRCSKALTLV